MDLSKFSYKKDESKLDAESPIHHRVNEGQTDAEDRQTDVGIVKQTMPSHLPISPQTTKKGIVFVSHHFF